MQFNETNSILETSVSSDDFLRGIKRLIYFCGVMLNLIIFINLCNQKSQLAIDEAMLQNREEKVSQREAAVEASISQLDEYNDYLQEQTDIVNEKINTLNDQYENLSAIEEKISSLDGNIYIPTPDEIDNLYKLVYAEAGNQPYEGKVAVAEVVFNRVECSDFPDTINDIIFDKYQFSPCYDGQKVRLVSGKEVSDENVTEEIKQAVNEAWYGSNITEVMLRNEAYSQGIYDTSYWKGGALYFANPKAIISDSLRASVLTSVVKVDIKDHTFRRKQ